MQNIVKKSLAVGAVSGLMLVGGAGLASADTVHIGILYANSTAAYLSELLLGSLEQSSLSGCQLVLEHCEDLESERKASRDKQQSAIRAVLTPEQQKTFDEQVAKMKERKADREAFEAWKAEHKKAG